MELQACTAAGVQRLAERYGTDPNAIVEEALELLAKARRGTGGPCRWSMLPDDLAGHIFNRLNAADACAARLVCSRWASQGLRLRQAVRIHASKARRLVALHNRNDAGMCSSLRSVSSLTVVNDSDSATLSFRLLRQVSQLPQLTELHLHRCLHARDVEAISPALHQLQHLCLFLEEGSGRTPDMLKEALCNASQLQSLSMSLYNVYQEVMYLKLDFAASLSRYLQKLKLVDVSFNGEGLGDLACLPLLTQLTLEHCRFSKVEFAALPRLASLHLLDPDFSEPVPLDDSFGHLTCLTSLTFRQSADCKNFPVPFQLPQTLSSLTWSSVGLGDQLVTSVIGQCTSLVSLDVESLRSPTGTNSTEQQLELSTLTNSGLEALRPLTQLTCLSLSGHPVADASGLLVLQDLPGITSLGLADMNIGLEEMKVLKEMSQLRELRLQNCLPQAQCGRASAWLSLVNTNLRSLDLLQNPGLTLKHLKPLTSLTSLELLGSCRAGSDHPECASISSSLASQLADLTTRLREFAEVLPVLSKASYDSDPCGADSAGDALFQMVADVLRGCSLVETTWRLLPGRCPVP